MTVATTNREGFSLVEIIVAIMILSFGLLAMASSTGYVSTQLRSSAFDTQRNLARNQIIEQLRGTFWSSVVGGSQTVGRYTITISVATPNSVLKRVNVITSGPAYRSGRGARVTIVDTAVIQIVRPK